MIRSSSGSGPTAAIAHSGFEVFDQPPKGTVAPAPASAPMATLDPPSTSAALRNQASLDLVSTAGQKTRAARDEFQTAQKLLHDTNGTPPQARTPEQYARHEAKLQQATDRVHATRFSYEGALHFELTAARQALTPADFDRYAKSVEQREDNAAAQAVDPKLSRQTLATSLTLEAAEYKVAELQSGRAMLPDSALVAAQAELADLRVLRAVRVLDRDFAVFDTAAKPKSSADSIISDRDLQRVRDGAEYTEEQREAASCLLDPDHVNQLGTLDTAARGGDRDKRISRLDVTAYVTAYDLNHPSAAMPVLRSQTVSGSAVNPTILTIEATAPAGANWGKNNGNQAGILSVYVDGKYQADATILSENPDAMVVNLGVLGMGRHKIEIRETTSLGRTGASNGGVTIVKAEATELTMYDAENRVKDNEALAARYAPIVYLDDYGKFNNPSQSVDNTPLLMTAKVTPGAKEGTTDIRYSVLYSNEDDGYGKGDAKSLADNWGRTTDDQWVYTVTVDTLTNEVVGLKSQDVGSDWSKLTANSVSGRPQVAIVDGHNNYGLVSRKQGTVNNRAFSGAPQVIAEKATTIDVMNDNAWTWKVSTEEVEREGELEMVRPNQRLYLNLEECKRGGFDQSLMQVELALKNGDTKLIEFQPASPDSFSIDLSKHGISDPAQVAFVHVAGMLFPIEATVSAQYLDQDAKVHKIKVMK